MILRPIVVLYNPLYKNWGGENRHVYRWNFNPIFVPYPKVSGVRCQEWSWHQVYGKE